MKKLLTYIVFVLLLVFCARTTTFATTYPLSATVSPSSIAVTMTGVGDTTSEFELYNGTNPVPPNDLISTDTVTKKAVGGKIDWTISGAAFKNNTTYYLHVIQLPYAQGGVFGSAGSLPIDVTATIPVVVGTGDGAPFYTWPTVSSANGQTAVISGKIDTTKYPQTGNLKIELLLSTSPNDFSNATHYIAHNAATGGGEGVASDGSYYWNLTSLTPSTTYYIEQIIHSGDTVVDTHSDKFNSSTGYTPVGSQKEQDQFNDKSYHLLAPWPGLAVLLDPDLCAQQKATGKLAPGAICDVNGFLNFAFRTLIGLTAVVLVLRLMYEGYQYMVTDVPFLKASAKSGFMSALFGLLLALSAYLILNTINPKLVENTIKIASVDVSIDDEIETAPSTTYVSGNDTVSCPQGFTDVATFGTPAKINVCKSIATNLTNLLAAAKNNNIILSGYGSRSTDQQLQLRRAHGCPDDNTPSFSCKPPTARPGHSMHERGMAIDFNCNGTAIGQQDHANICYVWLSKNAALYGFKNLPSEAWHWSVNGK